MSEVKKDLTYEQNQAFKVFKEWLEKPEKGRPFILTGFAGSGKTFLAGTFLGLVEEKNICWTVAAPTHKAVGVLCQVLKETGFKPIWHPSTIHRLLRLRIKRKGDLELCSKTDQTDNSLESLGLVLLDESSMIDSKLLEIILECAYRWDTRLVFLGDPDQLPPIGEDKSPVFSLKTACKFQLQKVIRHQGPVLKLATLIRQKEFACIPPPCIPMFKTDMGLMASVEKTQWLDQAKISLRNAAKIDRPDAARILCYTNKTLESLVPHVRKAIHGKLADQFPVLPGEVLLTRNAVMTPASLEVVEDLEEPNMILGPNRELIVIDIEKELCSLSDFGLDGYKDLDLPLIETLMAKVSCDEREFSFRLSPPAGSNSRNILDKTLSHLRVIANNASHEDKKYVWRKFFLVRDAFASLGPASVLTVHRSQGSTFEEVFIASDIFWPKDAVLRRQLAYVAVTRASKSVWLIGDKGAEGRKSFWQSEFTL